MAAYCANHLYKYNNFTLSCVAEIVLSLTNNKLRNLNAKDKRVKSILSVWIFTKSAKVRVIIPANEKKISELI